MLGIAPELAGHLHELLRRPLGTQKQLTCAAGGLTSFIGSEVVRQTGH